MSSLMLKSVYAEFAGRSVPIIVDCGYTSEERSRVAFRAIRAAGVAKSRFSVEGFGRLLCELPPRKAAGLLAALPIVEGSTYWRTTHHWPAEAKTAG